MGLSPDESAGRRLDFVPPTTCFQSRRAARTVLAVVVVAAAASAVTVWFIFSRQDPAAERAAKTQLEQLGAIVVMDGAQRHVASVNLSLLAARKPPTGSEPSAAAQPTETSADPLEQGLALLADLPNLTALDVSGTSFDDVDARALHALRGLKSLSASDTAITDAGLDQFAALGELQSLTVSHTRITGAGLGPLADLGDLKVLDLSGTDVADRLEPLAELDALEWAVLRVLSLKEGALAPLADCKSLRRVSLNESQVSATTIEAFRAQRPDVQLDGPWRAPGSSEDSLPDAPREAAAEGP